MQIDYCPSFCRLAPLLILGGDAAARPMRRLAMSGVEALRAGLRDLGYVEGKNIVIEVRWAERVEHLPEMAAELISA